MAGVKRPVSSEEATFERVSPLCVPLAAPVPAGKLLFPRQLKSAVVAVFTVGSEKPLLCDVVLVHDLQHHLAHMSFGWVGEIGGVKKIEGKCLAVVRYCGLHAWLVLRGAIMSEHQTIVVDVIHGEDRKSVV